jgi:hypothetical protein
VKRYLCMIVVVALATAGCFRAPQQDRAEKALVQVPVPVSGGANDFRERKSVIEADTLRNRADIVFFAYHLADDGQLIDQWTCLGSPVSSTESVEPNQSYPAYGNGSVWEHGWETMIEGQRARSAEVMGLDGTFGDPAPFFYCITPEGHYEQWSIFDKVRVTTVPRVYPTRVVKIDTQYAVKLAAAQKTLAKGGCVNDLLDPVDCSTVRRNIEGGSKN